MTCIAHVDLRDACCTCMIMLLLFVVTDDDRVGERQSVRRIALVPAAQQRRHGGCRAKCEYMYCIPLLDPLGERYIESMSGGWL